MRAHVEPFLHKWLGFHPALRHADREQRLHGNRRPDDHDDPDHLGRSAASCSSTVPRDIEGGGARRSARRAGRWSAASRSRTCAAASSAAVILGLGRALGEAIAVTQVIGNAFVPLSISLFAPGEHAREPASPSSTRARRRRLSFQSLDLPRADPARDHVDHERRRAANRPPLQRPTAGLSVASVDATALAHGDRSVAPPADRQPDRRGRSGRSRRCSRSGCSSLLVGSVFVRGLPRAQPGLLHEGPGRLRPDGRRDRPGVRRHDHARWSSQRRSRCRSACCVAIYVSRVRAPPARRAGEASGSTS